MRLVTNKQSWRGISKLKVHKQAEDELQRLLANLNDLLVKVTTANVVLKQTKGIWL